MMFLPLMMLAMESAAVIRARCMKIASGTAEGGQSECRLMVDEKIQAMFASYDIVLKGGDVNEIVDHYRKHVAANADRLSL
jgi:hypothetical protein